MSATSPEIEALQWGRMRVTGLAPGKDFKLWPGGGRDWDWRETGTRHRPGIQVADVDELVDRGGRIIVLSRGMLEALHTGPETLAHLERLGLVVHVEETRRAAERYNRLARAAEPVAGLFHSTC